MTKKNRKFKEKKSPILHTIISLKPDEETLIMSFSRLKYGIHKGNIFPIGLRNLIHFLRISVKDEKALHV